MRQWGGKQRAPERHFDSSCYRFRVDLRPNSQQVSANANTPTRGLFLGSLSLVIRGDAQSSANVDTPVWTVEFVKVRPDKMGLALGYLDDHWMRLRVEAKRQGAILSYHRISGMLLVTPGVESGDPNSILLLTEYKNFAAFADREKRFVSVSEKLPGSASGVVPAAKQDDLFTVVNTHVFQEEPPGPDSAEFKLLTR